MAGRASAAAAVIKLHLEQVDSNVEVSLLKAHFSAKKIFFRILPIIICLVIVASATAGKNLTLEDILRYTPKQPWLAALVLLGMFGLKSLSVVFPIVVLFFAGGILFPTPIALLVNTVGVAITITIPYVVGRWYGPAMSENIAAKYPKIQVFQHFRKKHDFFFSFFLRALGVLPCDFVSAYMGAIGVPYFTYLAGGILGFWPGLCAATVMGTSISDPTSPAFYISLLIGVALSVSSSVIFARCLYQEKKGKQQ